MSLHQWRWPVNISVWSPFSDSFYLWILGRTEITLCGFKLQWILDLCKLQ